MNWVEEQGIGVAERLASAGRAKTGWFFFFLSHQKVGQNLQRDAGDPCQILVFYSVPGLVDLYTRH